MSTITFTDLVSGSDVLTETKFEPWWEKLRSYFMRSLLAISLFIFYIAHVAKPIRCVSTHRTNISLSTQENLFINSYCYGQMNSTIRYSGMISFSASLVLFFVCRSWLLFPSVINAFRIIRQVDDMIGANDLSRTDIERRALHPRKNEEDKGKISHACWKIFHRDVGCWSISLLYAVRNMLAFIALVLCAVYSGVTANDMNDEDTFRCKACNVVESVIGPEEYLCSNELRLQLRPYLISYCVASCLMLLMIFVAFLMCWWSGRKSGCVGFCCGCFVTACDSCCSRQPSHKIKRIDHDNSFIRFLGKHSHRIHTATKTLLTISSETSLQIMSDNGLGEAIEHWDRDYIKLFLLLLDEDGKKKMVDKLNELKPWRKKKDFHKHVFDLPEIFEIAMEKKDFGLVCNLHHGLFRQAETNRRGEREPGNAIDYKFMGCGCYKNKIKNSGKTWSLEESSADSKGKVYTFLKHICDRYGEGNGQYDPTMTKHFLHHARSEDVPRAARRNINGHSIFSWLTQEVKEGAPKDPNGWDEMIFVLQEKILSDLSDVQKKQLQRSDSSQPPLTDSQSAQYSNSLETGRDARQLNVKGSAEESRDAKKEKSSSHAQKGGRDREEKTPQYPAVDGDAGDDNSEISAVDHKGGDKTPLLHSSMKPPKSTTEAGTIPEVPSSSSAPIKTDGN